ncbi:MAG TPA: hypothetical protein PLC65_17965, partial [Bacteroidia bacterium]|nr:hypothetical protein [Bacteroidia bacterium]
SEVVTVEHNKEWYEVLSDNIKQKSAWKGLFIEGELRKDTEETNFANPNLYLSSDKDYIKYSFKNYASSIDTYPTNYFDVVLVDGRARPSCIM